ncbi:penicillin-binding transpeptidase domain-containing protein [Proteiniborus sp. MB09-C3]|uniref:peptidoglycan D,D-transpeptidase FtsI family protein n=1 Tax=Proteiniborus sp. MB09-C3 TaxID=3050072 RepID=UPI0025528B3A|nr:penicillin-binding transpeptidase domain-containing protein [Proteiniborus sp. MB09-C3]WIV11177.1 penicillin-binding transpeptidase domain-containing protein [Proteiniborus sp. MB09-C3]
MDKKTRNNIYRRAKKIMIVSTIVFAMLVIRLFWIQIVKGQKYGLEAGKQYVREIRVAPARGNIFDRNNVQLTNNKTEKTIYIFRDAVSGDDETLEKIREAFDLSEKDIEIIKKSSNRIIEIPLSKEVEDNISIRGVTIEERKVRYDGNNLLSHVIGYIKKSENVGEYGIEKEYDSILKMNDSFGVKYVAVDGKQRVIPGLKDTEVISEKKTSSNSVKLTVDINIQKAVEKVLDYRKVNGAAIVTEVTTGDILAMASRPTLNQNDIGINFNSNNMDFYNKALEVAYPPGSIFKTVVMLAALEEDLISFNDTFVCEGYEDLGSFKIKCNNTEGHGEITAYEAFSKSCNSAFIQIGKKVGAKKIIDMAKRLGFGEKIQNILIESSGNLPKNDELLGPAIGNISIGQSNIEVTPIQVTNMMMIIANEGVKKDISIVDSIVTEEGGFVKKVMREKEERALSTKVSKQIKKVLEGVVDNGTAKNINMSSIGGAAGKTGSAENSKKITHAWFSGYFPSDKPKYVITVFIEEGGSGGKIAAPIFEEIAKSIYDIDLK